MKLQRIVILVPELIGEPDVVSLNRDGMVNRLHPLSSRSAFAASFFGLNPDSHQFSEGPLLAAFAGIDPPLSAVSFAASLCGVTSEGLNPNVQPSADEWLVLERELPRLGGKKWQLFCKSPVCVLISEDGRLELQTYRPQGVGPVLEDFLPEGDGEAFLRTLIDGSRNLLAELEFNHIRREEGKPTIDIVWPWGQGLRPQLPNLPLRLGSPMRVTLGDPAFLGLAKLLGVADSHLPDSFRRKWGPPPPKYPIEIFALWNGAQARAHHQFDRLGEWFHELLVTFILAQLDKGTADEPVRMLLASPSKHTEGLAIELSRPELASSGVPFHSRVIGDSAIPIKHLWELVEEFLQPPRPLV